MSEWLAQGPYTAEAEARTHPLHVAIDERSNQLDTMSNIFAPDVLHGKQATYLAKTNQMGIRPIPSTLMIDGQPKVGWKTKDEEQFFFDGHRNKSI